MIISLASFALDRDPSFDELHLFLNASSCCWLNLREVLGVFDYRSEELVKLKRKLAGDGGIVLERDCSHIMGEEPHLVAVVVRAL